MRYAPNKTGGHLHCSQIHCLRMRKSLLSYVPAYEPEQAILESVRWLIDHDELEVTGMLLA